MHQSEAALYESSPHTHTRSAWRARYHIYVTNRQLCARVCKHLLRSAGNGRPADAVERARGRAPLSRALLARPSRGETGHSSLESGKVHPGYRSVAPLLFTAHALFVCVSLCAAAEAFDSSHVSARRSSKREMLQSYRDYMCSCGWLSESLPSLELSITLKVARPIRRLYCNYLLQIFLFYG